MMCTTKRFLSRCSEGNELCVRLICDNVCAIWNLVLLMFFFSEMDLLVLNMSKYEIVENVLSCCKVYVFNWSIVISVTLDFSSSVRCGFVFFNNDSLKSIEWIGLIFQCSVVFSLVVLLFKLWLWLFFLWTGSE
jgi:hypothetical protein